MNSFVVVGYDISDIIREFVEMRTEYSEVTIIKPTWSWLDKCFREYKYSDGIDFCESEALQPVFHAMIEKVHERCKEKTIDPRPYNFQVRAFSQTTCSRIRGKMNYDVNKTHFYLTIYCYESSDADRISKVICEAQKHKITDIICHLFDSYLELRCESEINICE